MKIFAVALFAATLSSIVIGQVQTTPVLLRGRDLPVNCNVQFYQLVYDQYTQTIYACNTNNGAWVTEGTGTVTSVSGTAGQITVSTPTTTPVLSLANTAVTPGSYTSANVTVDQFGRITAASNGSAGANITQGSYASLPGTCATNDLYLPTNTVYNIARCSATNTWTWFLNGRIANPPGPVSAWTGVNVGAQWTASDAAGAIDVALTNSGGTNWRILEKSAPATPYTVTYFWKSQGIDGSSNNFGAYFYDGTKLMGLENLGQNGNNQLRVEKITNTTTDGSTAASGANVFGNSSMWAGIYVCLANDGTNLSFEWSLNGTTWQTLFSEAVGTYITPTAYGFGGINNTPGTAYESMQHVHVGTTCGA